MRLLKRLATPISILFLLTSCLTLFPNVEFCGKIPKRGGQCAFTIRGPKRRISEKAWNHWANNTKLGMVCTDAKGMGAIMKTFKKMCARRPKLCKSVKKDPYSHIDELEKILLP